MNSPLPEGERLDDPNLHESPARHPEVREQTAVGPAGKSGKGWLLRIRGGRFVAIGERELVHILAEDPVKGRIPGAPRHAGTVMVWRERMIPLLDLAGLFDDDSGIEDAGAPVIGLVAYRASGGVTGLGALALQDVPRRLETSETTAHEFPPQLQALASWSLSSLGHSEHGVIPILHLSKLFGTEPQAAAEPA